MRPVFRFGRNPPLRIFLSTKITDVGIRAVARSNRHEPSTAFIHFCAKFRLFNHRSNMRHIGTRRHNQSDHYWTPAAADRAMVFIHVRSDDTFNSRKSTALQHGLIPRRMPHETIFYPRRNRPETEMRSNPRRTTTGDGHVGYHHRLVLPLLLPVKFG